MPSDMLHQGRAAYAECRWNAAFDRFTEADAEAPVAAQDLEWWSTAAVMLGRDAAGIDAMTREPKPSTASLNSRARSATPLHQGA